MIEKRFLVGIVIRDSVGTRVESKEGRPKMVYTKVERAAVPEDILAYKDYGATIVLVTCDGRKYSVSKVPKVPEGGSNAISK